MKKIIYLINPYSNEGRAVKQWHDFRKRNPLLPKNPLDLTTIKDLSHFLEKSNPDIIAIAGGDGTINRVCTAVYTRKKKPLLAVIPLGYGNALAHCLGVETMEKAFSVLSSRPATVMIDLMKTNNAQYPIGVLNISVGFDAHIVHDRMTRRYFGLRSYFLSALRKYLSYSAEPMSFVMDGTLQLNATSSSLVIANCPVVGKKFVVSPHAKLNDGLLDATLFSTKYAYITNFRLKGFKHPLYSNLGKVHSKVKQIQISGKPFLQVDGDPVFQKKPITIRILPQKVTFLRNIDSAIDQQYMPFVQ